jgi:hypothetical protein
MDTLKRALVVTDDLDRAATWMGWLRRADYVALGCVGPGLTLDCPRLHGTRCVLREICDVALVDLASDEDADLCTKIPDDGSTVFIRSGSPSEGDHRGIMDSIDAARTHVALLQE